MGVADEGGPCVDQDERGKFFGGEEVGRAVAGGGGGGTDGSLNDLI